MDAAEKQSCKRAGAFEPQLGAQQPQPPPGWGGMPTQSSNWNGSVGNMTWTPSTDGGGLYWDGKSWNNGAAKTVDPVQMITSAKADVADAVAVRHAISCFLGPLRARRAVLAIFTVP